MGVRGSLPPLRLRPPVAGQEGAGAHSEGLSHQAPCPLAAQPAAILAGEPTSVRCQINPGPVPNGLCLFSGTNCFHRAHQPSPCEAGPQSRVPPQHPWETEAFPVSRRHLFLLQTSRPEVPVALGRVSPQLYCWPRPAGWEASVIDTGLGLRPRHGEVAPWRGGGLSVPPRVCGHRGATGPEVLSQLARQEPGAPGSCLLKHREGAVHPQKAIRARRKGLSWLLLASSR